MSNIKTRDGKTLPDEAFYAETRFVPQAELDKQYGRQFKRDSAERIKRARDAMSQKNLRR